MEKNKRKNTRFQNFLLFIAVALFIQAGLSMFQQARYERGVYDCDDMSKDCEYFFEILGINTEVRWGREYGAKTGHCWIALDTVFGWIEFETTNLQFASISDRYDILYHDSGWVHNGYFTTKKVIAPMPAVLK